MLHLLPVRVLLIDDDESVRRKACAWLSEAAYDVTAFANAADARQFIANAAVQIILVDLNLPDHDGVELVAELRRAAPRSAIIALVALPEPAQLIAAVRAGARDILEKPLQSAALFAALERRLADTGVAVRSEDEFNRRLGSQLRAVRSASNRTLADVATASGLSTAQLSQIELGKSATSTWTLARICHALQVRPVTLLENL